MTRVLYIGLIIAVYVACVGHASFADVALAAMAGAALSFHAQSPERALSIGRLLQRTVGLPALLFGIAREIVSGSRTMLAVTLGFRTWRNLGIVEVPIGRRTELGLSVSILVITVSPGSFVVGVDRARGVVRVHVIDASEPEAIVARLQEFYAKYQRRVVP